MSNHCPVCKSTDIIKRFYVPTSKYGHLPTPPVDYCNFCGYKSEESFMLINFRLERDCKIEKILDKNGIQ